MIDLDMIERAALKAEKTGKSYSAPSVLALVRVVRAALAQVEADNSNDEMNAYNELVDACAPFRKETT